jgi:hypothetical protein
MRHGGCPLLHLNDAGGIEWVDDWTFKAKVTNLHLKVAMGTLSHLPTDVKALVWPLFLFKTHRLRRGLWGNCRKNSHGDKSLRIAKKRSNGGIRA